MFRSISVFLAIAALAAATTARAQQNGFDLSGPDLVATVGRGGVQLPLAAVPSLRAGDRLTIAAALPADQSVKYLLVVAFLRGATNPPPKNWFFQAETWRRRRNTLDIVVPSGAEQAVLFLAPDTGGGFDAVRDAVRGRPGIFVRAAQDLQQASLDRARLETFVKAIGRIGHTQPERLASVAPVLADTLQIKLNADCLSRLRELQAACLTQNRDAMVLQAQRGSSLAETLTGTPVDLAYRVAATREGGAGFYSPYIGLARDLARLFGAFRSAQFQYLPSLALGRGDRLHLLLNAAPSFQNPRSVLVASLPPIGSPVPPVWRASREPACLARPDVAVPLNDAALLFATDYARDLSVRVTFADGRTGELPVVANAERGGVTFAPRVDMAGLGPVTGGILHGRWGFDPFTGPRLPILLDAAGAWRPQPGDAVVVGRDHPLVLRGGVAACVADLALRSADGEARPLTWKATAPDEVTSTLPLARVRPGPLTVVVARYGAAPPDRVAIAGRVEVSRLDRLVLHAGDRSAMLDGARLDQIVSLDLADTRFVPGALTRGTGGDRLELTAATVPIAEPGKSLDTTVRMRDGRTATIKTSVSDPRQRAMLVDRRVNAPVAPGSLPIDWPDGLLPADATLTFSIRVPGGLAATDQVEVATEDGAAARLTVASGAVQRVGDIAVASVHPQTLLGPAATGPLRFRTWHDDAAGDWQALARIVRAPAIGGLECTDNGGDCTLSGRDLFALAAVGDTPALDRPVLPPPGFVGSTLSIPRPRGRILYLRLHDAPDATVGVDLPAQK